MSQHRNFEKVRRLSGASESSSSEWNRSIPVFVGILTISDRCARGEKCDLSGPNLQKIIQEHDRFRSVVKVYKIVADEVDQIADTLRHWSDDLNLGLIVTTGGTGIGSRDVTPEATAKVIDKETPGFTIAIITASLKVTPDAMVTRLKCGIRGTTIIINVPGSKKASAECLTVVLPAIPHAIKCLRNAEERGCSCTSTDDYPDICTPARRKSAKERKQQTSTDSIAGSNFSDPPNEPHSLVYKPPTIVSITDDEKNLNDTDLESIVSVGLNTPLPTSEASVSQEGSTISLTRSTISTVQKDSDVLSVTVEKGLETLKTVVRNLESEETSIIDAFGRILSEDVSVKRDKSASQLIFDSNAVRSMGVGNSDDSLFEEINSDRVTVKRGTLLSAHQIGLMAAEGLSTCKTFKVPTVGVLSIGEKDKIIANHVTLQIYLQQSSIKVIDLGITGHSLGLLPEVFRTSMLKADIVVIISNLESCRDMSTSLITKIFGGIVHFKSITMRPRAKTCFITTNRQGKQNLFFVLPENPLGCTISSLLLIPAYRKLAGYRNIENKRIKAKFPMLKELHDEPEYLQCKVSRSSKDNLSSIETVIDNKDARQFQYGINGLVTLPSRTDVSSTIRPDDAVETMLTDVNNQS